MTLFTSNGRILHFCMRKFSSIYPRISYPYPVIHNTTSPTQKLHFSAKPNGQGIIYHSYVRLLHDPTRITSLNDIKCLHAIVITTGSFPLQESIFLHNNIISKYAALGEIPMARKLFDEMPLRNAVTYNSMISCYNRDGIFPEVLGTFSGMRKCGLNPTQFTFGSLLSCRLLNVMEGMQLQALIEKAGFFHADAFAGTALLGMYARHGYFDEALKIFEFMPIKNVATWNSAISILAQMGCVEDYVSLFSEMMMSHVGLSVSTFVNVLSGLQEVDMEVGEQIHGLVIKHGFDNVAPVCNCVIKMYFISGEECLAERMFKNARVKDVVSWNTLIGGLANGDDPTKALYTFQQMLSSGVAPNDTTLVNVLQSCSRLHLLSCGECIHSKMIKKSFESDVISGSALVSFYAKCDKVQESHCCFHGISQKNTVSWNSLMLGYSNRGSSFSTKLLQEMIRAGYHPNAQSFSIVTKSALMTEMRQLHSLTIKMGYHENAYVSSSLICSYARNDLLYDALQYVESDQAKLPIASSNNIAWIYNRTGQYEKTQELYAEMEYPDTVSWNILLAACSRNGDYKETFELFNFMLRSRVFPDNYTFVSLFSVCTKLCSLTLGSLLHSLIIKADFSLCDTFVCNTMIDMYGKCGSLESSVKIFNEMTERNIISWTALISALGLHGCGNEAIERFREMEGVGIRPDKVAFLAVVSACRHIGLVKEGMDLFEQMKLKYDLEPDIDHYVVVVDLLTRYGHIKEAEHLILGLPVAPNALIWRSFLEGCKKQTMATTLSLAA